MKTPPALMRVIALLAVAMLAVIALGTSTLTVTAATTGDAPRTTAIAWADCIYGLESLPTPPLAAYVLTADGVMMRSFDDGRTESTVIGPKRFRDIADGFERTFFGPPPEPTPKPTPWPGTNLVPIGSTTMSDTRRGRFAVRHDGAWTDWSVYHEFTPPEHAAVRAVYAAAYDPKLVWHSAAPRANAFAVCKHDTPLDAMTMPTSPAPSK